MKSWNDHLRSNFLQNPGSTVVSKDQRIEGTKENILMTNDHGCSDFIYSQSIINNNYDRRHG